MEQANSVDITKLESVSRRVEDVVGDVKTLDQKLSDFQRSVGETNNRFGARIGKLEAHNEVQDEQVRQIKETQNEIRNEIRNAQKEQKDSIQELRAEQKESLGEIKKTNKEILDAVTPMQHQVHSLESLKKEVDQLKEKPAKTWESIKEKSLGWAVAVILAIIGAALGLSKFL